MRSRFSVLVVGAKATAAVLLMVSLIGVVVSVDVHPGRGAIDRAGHRQRGRFASRRSLLRGWRRRQRTQLRSQGAPRPRWVTTA